jgi:hypothetical protein
VYEFKQTFSIFPINILECNIKVKLIVGFNLSSDGNFQWNFIIWKDPGMNCIFLDDRKLILRFNRAWKATNVLRKHDGFLGLRFALLYHVHVLYLDYWFYKGNFISYDNHSWFIDMDEVLMPINPSIIKDYTDLVAILSFWTENTLKFIRSCFTKEFEFGLTSYSIHTIYLYIDGV